MTFVRRSARSVGVCVVVLSSAYAIAPSHVAAASNEMRAHASAGALPRHWKPRAVTLPFVDSPSTGQLAAQSINGATVKTWRGSVKAGQDAKRYHFTIVGADPRVAAPEKMTKVVVVPVLFQFDSGDVFDPTVADSSCSEAQSAVAALRNGPIFGDAKYAVNGVSVGSTQYIDAVQREQFWNVIKATNPDYHLLLGDVAGPPQSVIASGYPEIGSGSCSATGFVDVNDFNNYAQATIFPALAADHIGPKTFVLFLFKNVVMYDGSLINCCITGFHTAFDNPAFSGAAQTYGAADYDTNGVLGKGSRDGSNASHEIAEWVNDPLVNNATPSWGNVGQVSGCANLLEVADPLTGTTFAVKVAGTTYHVQEIAFGGWFFADNQGVDGAYSTRGSFTQPSSLCG